MAKLAPFERLLCIVIFRTVVGRAKAEALEGTEYWAANKGSCINCQPVTEHFRPTPIACAFCSLDNCSENHNITALPHAVHLHPKNTTYTHKRQPAPPQPHHKSKHRFLVIPSNPVSRVYTRDPSNPGPTHSWSQTDLKYQPIMDVGTLQSRLGWVGGGGD